MSQLSYQMNTNRNIKGTHARNVTPNFLPFKRKSSLKNDKEEEVQGLHPQNAERSASKASRCSFDVYEKRVLHLSKLKNTLTIKPKQGSVDPAKKRKEGLEVTSRRTNSGKKQQNEQTKASNIVVVRKMPGSGSNKAIKLTTQSRQKSQRGSNPKRSEQSLEKEQQRAKLQNKQFVNNLIQQQFAPNYMNKLKIKKLEQREREVKRRDPLKKFLNVEVELKDQETLKQYELYAELGKGAYGVVRMGLSKKTNQKVAVKIYEKRRLDQPNKIKNLQRQINILSRLSHPVIARLIEVIQGGSEIFLIQEYGGANSLYNYLLSKPQHRMAESEAKQFFKTIAETIKYLHERNIVHRDIKAENILLNRNKQLKLIDFGFSLQSMPPGTIDTFCGTPTYMAPEIVSKRDHVPHYTDLWSLGVFLFVMLQGNYPFRAKNENDLFEKIRKGHFQYIHKDISQRSKHVIERLIRVNPMQRLSTEQMSQSFWQWFLCEQGQCVENTVTTTTHSS